MSIKWKTVIDRISCMPFHVSLGLAQALLHKIENLAIGIDNEIKTLNGIPTDEVRHLITTKSELCDQLEQLLN